MATNTPNYNLIKPDPDDFYDVGQFNQNADATDTALKGLQDGKETPAGAQAKANAAEANAKAASVPVTRKVNGKQLNADVTLTASEVGAEPAISAGSASQYIAGNKTLRTFAADVRTAVLTGLSTATNAAIAATDTVLSAFGKLQAQINAKQANITTGTTAQYYRGDKTWQDLASAIRGAALTGLSTATNAAIAATDTMLAAFGKLQAQITAVKTTADAAKTAAATAQTTANNAQSAASTAQSTANSAQNTANASMPKTGGTFTGQVYAADSATASKRVRNIQISTTDLTAGSSSLASGVVYLVYE